MRTTKIELNGTTYSLCLSTRVMMSLEDRAGSFSDFMGNLGRIDNKIFLLSELLRAGYLTDKAAGLNPPEPPDQEALLDSTSFDDYEAINQAISAAITAGTKRKVEARAKSKKDGAATQGE